MPDCEHCEFYRRAFSEHEDPDDAERALEEMNVCEICLEDAMQE